MKTILIAVAVVGLISSSVVFSAQETSSVTEMKSMGNINAGNISAGGSLGLNRTVINGNGSTVFEISPNVEYFVMDNLSVGGAGQLSHSFGDNATTGWRIGPSATYYFWHQDKVSTYLHDLVDWGGFNQSVTGNYQINTTRNSFANTVSLGAVYFINPSVAIGPSLNWRHRFGTDEMPVMNEYNLAANFGIYF